MSFCREVVEEITEGFIKVVFRNVDLPKVALFEVSMVSDGSDDCITLFATSEDLLQDGHDVWVEVALAGQSVNNTRNVHLSCCEQTSKFILEVLVFSVSIQQKLNV